MELSVPVTDGPRDSHTILVSAVREETQVYLPALNLIFKNFPNSHILQEMQLIFNRKD